ncbi:hypothetical protein HNP73_004571 [Amaricoccus macauensis]|uniref:DUF4238 domain-containing protein n=1 Tax=Amaricoccus macauensis TaxID=57001 RepID=A0A840SV11_9RHOB|nr:DUF4238 domain-containing protein [Amaricoccus macauensis]MBB5224600.1 hypothetical protein [Amaricoccus macauensis]
MPANQAAQNQHYVPKFILRNFLADTKGQRVHVFRKPTQKGFTTSIDNIMAERRFHEFHIEDNLIASFEGAVCDIENALLPTYRAVLERGTLDGSPEEKVNLISFIAFQFVRTRAQRDLFRDLQIQLDDRLGPEVVEGLDLGPQTEEERVLQHLRFMEEATPGFVAAMMDKDLALMKAPKGRSFYLSDNPVVLHNDKGKDSFYGNLGLAVEGIQIYLPLSAELMLCAWCPTLMAGMKEQHAVDKRRLASVMLAPFMGKIPANDYLQKQLDKLRPILKFREAWIKHVADGTPMVLNTDNMDFHNSLQVMSASQHVVCKYADFALATRFMKENPNDKGFRFRVN